MLQLWNFLVLVIVLFSLTQYCQSHSHIKHRDRMMPYHWKFSFSYKNSSSYEIYRPTVQNFSINCNFLRVCYYSFGDPEPEVINGTLCTHIIVGFSDIENGTLHVGEDIRNRTISTVNLKQKYPHLKVMFSIGGGGNDAAFSGSVKTSYRRERLLLSCFAFLLKYNLDGLDLDWEFPVWNDGVKEDKENFVAFLHDFKKLSDVFAPYMLLSVAVGAPKTIVDDSYDIPSMSRYVDFINLMSYDYHDYTLYTPFTGHNSPLFNRSAEHAYFSTLNTAWSALYWVKKGMPKEKIMVGLPTYGHSYRLLDAKLHDIDSPATGFGIGSGSVSLSDACEFIANGGVRIFDEQSQVPYAFKNFDWIGYDDHSSITVKTKWVVSQQFGGVMTFDLNCDDWQGSCDGKTMFPLHQIIYNILTNP